MCDSVWYHIDVNSAFLSWTAAYRRDILGADLDLWTVPAVIGGNEKDRHGIVLAKSIPAKQYRIYTGEALCAARIKCPELLVVPPDYPLYVSCSKALIRILRKYSDNVHQYSIDEAFADMTGAVKLFGDPVIFARQLKAEIYEQLGFTVNIGVSVNKLLAKMASEMKKPDRVHTLFPEEIGAKLWPLPVSELFMAGRATSKKLGALGIHTIGELAATDVAMLRLHLKKHGEVLWHYAHGRDDSPFLVPLAKNKGYGNSVTVPYDITDMDLARQVILSLAETVCARLRADGVKVCCVGVSFKDDEFERASAQMTLAAATDITMEVYRHTCGIFAGLWNKKPIRQMGVFTGRVTSDSARQYHLFEPDQYEKHRQLDAVIDEIRYIYGEDSVFRAAFLKSPVSHMSGGIDKVKRTGMTKELK